MVTEPAHAPQTVDLDLRVGPTETLEHDLVADRDPAREVARPVQPSPCVMLDEAALVEARVDVTPSNLRTADDDLADAAERDELERVRANETDDRRAVGRPDGHDRRHCGEGVGVVEAR